MKTINLYRTLIILILFSLSLAYPIQAEESDTTNGNNRFGGWFTMSLGMCHFGPTGYYNFSFSYNNNIITIRWLDSDELRFSFGPGGVEDFPRLSMKERGVLYGRSYLKEFLFMSISGGIGSISWIDRGKKITEHQYEMINISTYGMPFEARFRFNMGFLGIGGAWFGNINKQKFLSGGLIELSIGVF